jgi:hypothetical protein
VLRITWLRRDFFTKCGCCLFWLAQRQFDFDNEAAVGGVEGSDNSSRLRSAALPGFSDRMRLGVEDHFIEVQGFWGSKQKIEVFERLGEKEALH